MGGRQNQESCGRTSGNSSFEASRERRRFANQQNLRDLLEANYRKKGITGG